MKRAFLEPILACCLLCAPACSQALDQKAASDLVAPVKEHFSSQTNAQGLIGQASEAFYGRHLQEARALCQQAIAENHFPEAHMTAASVRFFLNRTACDIGLRDYQSARKTLDLVQKFLRSAKDDKEMELALADCFLLRAELNYKSGDSKSALPLYRQALTSYIDRFGLDSPTLSQPLEGMAVCLRKEGHLGRALSAERQAALNDYINLGGDNFRFCETLRFLIQLEHQAGYDDRAQVIQDLFATSLRAGFGKKLINRYQARVRSGEIKSQDLPAIIGRIERIVIGNLSQAEVKERMVKVVGVPRDILDNVHGKQQVMDFDSWICSRKEIEEPSTTIVINPQVPQIALIYCIHGLGLHGANFNKFGKIMADKGYPVLLPDIRGFGANANRKGFDLLEPADSLKDIYRALTSLKSYCPDLPLVILGESMGGALALQTAAKHSDLIAGLVCSVPSGSRFGGLADSLRVARGLIRGQKQIDVGKMIVNKATSDEESRERWQSDPEARLSMSPMELVKFQEFMDQNEKAAKSLPQIPVLFLQGDQDGLVKPMGTADLYMNLASMDKDFFVVGKQEHLIFEDENCPAWVPNALAAWLEDKLIASGRYKPQ